MRHLLSPEELAALLAPIDASAEGSAPGTAAGGADDLDAILDVGVQLTVEAGRAGSSIGALLALREGALVPFDGDADAPLRLYANGSLVAAGTLAVTADGRPALRVLRLMRP